MDEYELYTDRSSYDRTFPLGGKVKPKRVKTTWRESLSDLWWDGLFPMLLKILVIAGFLFLCGAGVMLATYSR